MIKTNFTNTQKNIFKATTLAALILVFGAPSVARSQSSAAAYQSGTLLGMGGSAAAGAEGADAVWQNPAALGLHTNGLDVELANPMVSLSEGFRHLTDDGKYFEDPDSLIRSAASTQNEPVAGSATIFPNIIFRGFGAGILATVKPEAMLQNAETMKVNLSANAQTGAIVGFGHAFFKERISLGVSAKALKQVYFQDTYNPEEDGDRDSQELSASLKEGLLLSVDAGLLFRFNHKFNPTLGIVAKNVSVKALDDKFRLLDGSASITAEEVAPTFNIGFSMAPQVGPFRLRVLFNLNDITGIELNDVVDSVGQLAKSLGAEEKAVSNTFLDRFSGGLELGLARRLFVRGGLANGQPALGAGIDLWVVRVDAAMYAKASQSNPNTYDRHFVAQLTAGF